MELSSEAREFVHPPLGREVTAIGGHYTFGREVRMSFHNRDILYFVGYAVLDSTCCGVGGVAYVLVAGLIDRWKVRKNREERFISTIEPILDQRVQEEIRGIIQNIEMVYQVNFD